MKYKLGRVRLDGGPVEVCEMLELSAKQEATMSGVTEYEIDPYYELEGKEYSLNINLIRDKCLTQEEVDKIKDLHIERIMVEAQLNRVYSRDEIRAWYKVWEQIQFDLQRSWGFELNPDYHPSHRLSCCSCPKIDCKLHKALRD